MPKTPKDKAVPPSNPPPPADDNDVLQKDQETRGYYYDDAHGYERYVPGDEADDAADREADKVS